MTVYWAAVTKAAGGFGMYQVGEWVRTDFADIDYYLDECDDRPEPTNEIDGRIYDQNGAAIYKTVANEYTSYCALREVATEVEEGTEEIITSTWSAEYRRAAFEGYREIAAGDWVPTIEAHVAVDMVAANAAYDAAREAAYSHNEHLAGFCSEVRALVQAAVDEQWEGGRFYANIDYTTIHREAAAAAGVDAELE